jgi:hypothetical protein
MSKWQSRVCSKLYVSKKRGKSAFCEREVRGSYYLCVSSNGKGVGEGAPIPMTEKKLGFHDSSRSLEKENTGF